MTNTIKYLALIAVSVTTATALPRISRLSPPYPIAARAANSTAQYPPSAATLLTQPLLSTAYVTVPCTETSLTPTAIPSLTRPLSQTSYPTAPYGNASIVVGTAITPTQPLSQTLYQTDPCINTSLALSTTASPTPSLEY